MLTKGFFIHDAALDAFIEIYNVVHYSSEGVKCKIAWWVFHGDGSYSRVSPASRPYYVRIKNDEIPRWKRINPLYYGPERVQKYKEKTDT